MPAGTFPTRSRCACRRRRAKSSTPTGTSTELYRVCAGHGGDADDGDAFALRRRSQPRSVGRRAVPGRRQHRAVPDTHVRQRHDLPARRGAVGRGDRRAAGDVLRSLSRAARAPRSSGCASGTAHAVVLDGHSIAARGAALFRRTLARPESRHERRRELRRDPRRRWPRTSCRMRRGFTHVVNGRFKGGYITRRLRHPARQRARTAARDGAGVLHGRSASGDIRRCARGGAREGARAARDRALGMAARKATTR